jgi:hypothetical protein
MNSISKKERKRSKRRSHQRTKAPPMVGAGAFSITQFCLAHGGMSEAMFYKLMRDNRGPQVMKVGGRTMVSAEAAAAWRRAREAEATAAKTQNNTESATA